jgi:hypothetical protein
MSDIRGDPFDASAIIEERKRIEKQQYVAKIDNILHSVTIDGKTVYNFCADEKFMNYLADFTEDEIFYEENVPIPQEYFVAKLQTIKHCIQAIPPNEKSIILNMKCFVEFLETEFKTFEDKFFRMNENGKITFNNIPRLFKIGKKFVVGNNSRTMLGSIISNIKICNTMFGSYYQIHGSFIITTGKNINYKEKTFQIHEFEGLANISDLSVRPITDEEHEALMQRGKIYMKYSSGVHHIECDGSMMQETYWGLTPFDATGRAEIDERGYCVMMRGSGGGEHGESPSEDDLWKCWYSLHAYSFVRKRWGEIYVMDVKDVEYDDNAYDMLVLEPHIKDIVKSLVMCPPNKRFTDIIKHKGGGCIFLLEGEPGVGKTLTCEAIAELLHKPLYSVTVGELGTTPTELENKLQKIIEMVKSWDAVVLLDEADIFLESRKDNDIARNAMVCIFLRLLERYTGVMFLTTNRADNLDDAFKSRISLTFEYPSLSTVTRSAIWTNLSGAAHVVLSSEQIDEFSTYALNGREIKNCINLATRYAHSHDEEPTCEHIKKILEVKLKLA